MASLEGFWKVWFGTGASVNELAQGHGVVVLETGRVFGGDSSFYYTGTYDVERGEVTMRVKVKRHGNVLENITGLEEPSFVFKGKALTDASRLELVGIVEQTEATVGLILDFLEDLP